MKKIAKNTILYQVCALSLQATNINGTVQKYIIPYKYWLINYTERTQNVKVHNSCHQIDWFSELYYSGSSVIK